MEHSEPYQQVPVAPGTGLVRGGRNSEIGIARAGKISSATNKKKYAEQSQKATWQKQNSVRALLLFLQKLDRPEAV